MRLRQAAKLPAGFFTTYVPLPQPLLLLQLLLLLPNCLRRRVLFYFCLLVHEIKFYQKANSFFKKRRGDKRENQEFIFGPPRKEKKWKRRDFCILSCLCGIYIYSIYIQYIYIYIQLLQSLQKLSQLAIGNNPPITKASRGGKCGFPVKKMLQKRNKKSAEGQRCTASLEFAIFAVQKKVNIRRQAANIYILKSNKRKKKYPTRFPGDVVKTRDHGGLKQSRPGKTSEVKLEIQSGGEQRR